MLCLSARLFRGTGFQPGNSLIRGTRISQVFRLQATYGLSDKSQAGSLCHRKELAEHGRGPFDLEQKYPTLNVEFFPAQSEKGNLHSQTM
jgi:hypothetical protein